MTPNRIRSHNPVSAALLTVALAATATVGVTTASAGAATAMVNPAAASIGAAAEAGAAPVVTAPARGQVAGVTTDAARYRPGDTVTLTVTLRNTRPSAVRQKVTARVSHLGHAVTRLRAPAVTLAAGRTHRQTLTWTAPKADFRGYLVQVAARDAAGKVVGRGQTAVDVSSSAEVFPRYGFAASFDSGVNPTAVADYANSLHLNHVQFYDWHYRHHVPLAGTPTNPAPSWTDIANRVNQRQVVLDMISGLHARGIDATSYNLAYGADSGYGEDGSGVSHEWALYRQPGCFDQDNHPLPAGWAADAIYVMDPGNTGWQTHLANREKDAFTAYPFDGWHADQLGKRGTRYTCGGTQITESQLAARFNGVLNAVDGTLRKKMIFNSVGQYAQQEVASNPNLDFLYTEAWPGDGQVTYADLKKVVDDNRAWSGGKNTVIAAYVNNGLSDAPGQFNTPAVLMADAVIFASGGAHIELGDVAHMLGNPYFPNDNLTMSPQLRTAIQSYYDFLVAYQNLLRGSGLAASGNRIEMPGTPTSTNGAGNTVWTFAKTQGTTDIVHFLNLTNNATTQWRDDSGTRQAPTLLTDRTAKYYYQGDVPTAVNLASPDVNGGAAQRLSFRLGSDANGRYVEFTLPSLNYWDMVWIDRDPARTGQITGLGGKCVDVAGGSSANGTPIQLWDCASVPAQTWTVAGGQLVALGKCMDLEAQGTLNGTRVHLWDCHAGDSQQWVYDASTMQLRNVLSGRCLDVFEQIPDNGTPLHIWDCHTGASQKWTLP